ncbi:hypothetical protein ACHAXA_006777 [Cyclostephanos tholiformis]|uniref:SHSP domain-containing protein n=1 Tax=Cyclostephanos tholiformis TaxID=382380 RepID=A0ABD3R6E6_9STRA
MIRRATNCKMSLAFLSPTSVLPSVNYCGGSHLLLSGPKMHHPRTFSQPGLRSVFPGFDSDFFAMPSRLLDFPPTLTHFKDDIMRHSSPRYEITENEKQFRLAVDVPGMKPDNLKIELEDDGRVMHISGERKVNTDKSREEYQFDKRFTLRKDLDTSKITAHLSDGVLVVTVMKMENLPPSTQPIEIVQGEAPAMMDAGEKMKSVHHPRTFSQPGLRSVFPGFDSDFFTMPSPLLGITPTITHSKTMPYPLLGITPTLTHFKDDIMRHSSPRYEITENEKQFRLAVDVPGMKPDNLKIELEDDGRVMHISGERKVETDKSHEEYLFDKRFTLRKDLDTSKITAHLSDGVLVVTVMKMENLPPATQPIEIIQGEAPAMMDAGEKLKSVHHPHSFSQPDLRSVFAGFDSDFFTMPSRLLDFPPTLTHFKDDIMRHSSPRYEITENDEQFRLAVDVPGMKHDNLKIELEDDGRVMHISGKRKVETDKSHEEYLFDKRFTLRKDLDTSKITAHLSDGVLVVTVMKMENLPPSTQPIEIVQGEAPAMMDAGEKLKSGELAP